MISIPAQRGQGPTPASQEGIFPNKVWRLWERTMLSLFWVQLFLIDNDYLLVNCCFRGTIAGYFLQNAITYRESAFTSVLCRRQRKSETDRQSLRHTRLKQNKKRKKQGCKGKDILCNVRGHRQILPSHIDGGCEKSSTDGNRTLNLSLRKRCMQKPLAPHDPHDAWKF